MNLIVVGFQNETHHPIIYKLLKEFSVKMCHIVYGKIKMEVPSFTKPIYYQHWDIYYNGPDLSQVVQSYSIDERILKDMAYFESIVLKMMDQWQVHLRDFRPEFLKYEYRKKIYLKNVRYWNYILNEQKIDLVIFDNIPHQIYDFILYGLCKLSKIPTIVICQTIIEDTAIFVDNLEDVNLKIKEKYEKLRLELKDTPYSKIELTKRFQLNVDKLIGKGGDPVPFYMKGELRRKSSLMGRFKALFRIIFRINRKKKIKPSEIKKYRKRTLLNQELYDYYENKAVEPDLSKKFIYLALHLQPELSTSPMSGVFVEQNLIIHLLAEFLPKDIFLYVKEHPRQTSLCRSKEFYDELLQYENVRLIKRDVDSFSLIKNSIAIATGAGTVGWESLFKEKPVILFGNIFYKYVHGVFAVKTREDCQNALNDVIDNKIKPSIKDVIIFLKAMESNSIEGYIDLDWVEVSSINNDQNIKNFSDALLHKIKTIFEEK